MQQITLRICAATEKRPSLRAHHAPDESDASQPSTLQIRCWLCFARRLLDSGLLVECERENMNMRTAPLAEAAADRRERCFCKQSAECQSAIVAHAQSKLTMHSRDAR